MWQYCIDFMIFYYCDIRMKVSLAINYNIVLLCIFLKLVIPHLPYVLYV